MPVVRLSNGKMSAVTTLTCLPRLSRERESVVAGKDLGMQGSLVSGIVCKYTPMLHFDLPIDQKLNDKRQVQSFGTGWRRSVSRFRFPGVKIMDTQLRPENV